MSDRTVPPSTATGSEPTAVSEPTGLSEPAGGAGAGSAVPPAPPVDGAPRRRPRVVLWTSLAVAVVVAVLVAVLASSSSAGSGTASSPLVGKAAPSVGGPALRGGGNYSLSQFHGRWVLVNFAASWCVPCRQETPQLVRFQDEHRSAGDATVLGVVFDPNDVSNLAAFLARSGSTWPTVEDSNAEVAYGVSAIPQSYLVDPQGTVVAKFFGGVTAAQVDGIIKRAGGV